MRRLAPAPVDAEEKEAVRAGAGRSKSIALSFCLIATVVCRDSAIRPKAQKPNIILYIIDGAAADLMSVYGYPRRTTRYLERLAAEGAVFENAYSNSSVTKVSVPSFMTSLHGSVLGGFRSGSDPLPEQAVTMAERMREAGYKTEVLTSNPYCGRISSLDRGVDIIRDTELGGTHPSSADLHREFWRLREAHPAEPYWVHFQPMDVHQPWASADPFTGPLISPADRLILGQVLDRITWTRGLSFEEGIGKSDIGAGRFYEIAKKLYEESMIFEDREIGKLVERLKKKGEWDRTLFIVAADHSQVSAGLPFLAPGMPPWEAPLLASHKSRIPMIFVWPEKIPAGRRLSQPVSMIDILPTVLDLAGLPRPEIAQGQSLAPLLLGKSGWKQRPVVLDEFRIDGKYLFGSIEVIDGRWGTSLWIDQRPDSRKSALDRLRPAPLLVFNVREDPHAFKSLHAQRPDLVAKYSRILGRLWKEHLALARKFTRAGAIRMTSEEFERLRSLGYLR